MQTTISKNFSFDIYKQYLKELFILAFPLFIGSLGHTLIGATDVFVVAKYSINSLAAISIANSIIFTIFIFGIGITTAISILLSNMRGQKNKIKQFLPTTLFFSLILSIIFTTICFFSKYIIPHCGFEGNLVPYIQEYITIVSFSMFGIFFFEGMKQFLQAYEIVIVPNTIILCTVFVNLLLDFILVFGYGNIPAMGSKGAAFATLITRTLMAVIIFIYIIKYINIKDKIDYPFIKQVIKIGIPIGFALVFEFLAFNIITVLIGREASVLAAIHSILITIASATYMVPFALSTAVSVKVAYFYGAKSPKEIRKYSYTTLITSVGFMILTSAILAIFPKQIIGLFTMDKEVIRLSLPIISVAAVYQIFDGFQAVTGGILKGFKMTKAVSISVIASYWGIGAPVAMYFVGICNFSLKGYWIALAVSLCVMGVVQAAIAKRKYRLLLKDSER